ncbi:MAG TPA: TIGR00153 family protein [Candidatus Thermoplasmatota archaeon]|nr:TIGR00153 family protein [Candidatus Thermoplasmatota archaeon]
MRDERQTPVEDVPHTSPLDRILRRKSPYDGLFEHAAKVAECVRLLDEGFQQYTEGRYDEFSQTTRRIGEVEHEADIIKAKVSSHLPRHLFMSAGTRQFEMLLTEQDGILDHVEDLSERMDARRTPIPPQLRDSFRALARASIATVDAYEKAMEAFADVLATGFGSSARDEVKTLVKTVHQREFEGDRIRFGLLRDIYAVESQLQPLDVMHLVLFADVLDDVADAAEAAAERLRAIVAQ